MATRLDQMLMDFDEKRPGGPKKVKMGPEDRRNLQRVLSPEEFAAERVVPKGPTPLQVNATMPDRINPLPAGLEPPNPEQAGGRGILQRLADPRNRAPISQFMGTLAARIDPNGLGAALGGTAAEQAESSLVARALEGDESAYKYLAPERVAQIESLQAQREEVERRREAGERDEARVGLEAERVGVEQERVGLEGERVSLAAQEQERKVRWDEHLTGIMEGELSVQEGRLALEDMQKDINWHRAHTERIAAEALAELRRKQAEQAGKGGGRTGSDPLVRVGAMAKDIMDSVADPKEAFILDALAEQYDEMGYTEEAAATREMAKNHAQLQQQKINAANSLWQGMAEQLGFDLNLPQGVGDAAGGGGVTNYNSVEEVKAANPPLGATFQVNGTPMMVIAEDGERVVVPVASQNEEE